MFNMRFMLNNMRGNTPKEMRRPLPPMLLGNRRLHGLTRRRLCLGFRISTSLYPLHLFSKETCSIELSFRFVMPKFELYDDMTDPTRYVLHYKQLMEKTMMSI